VKQLRVDFLYLDLTTCTRCRGTQRSLETALDTVRQVLAMTDAEVEVNMVHVESAEQARRLRFQSSPTIRVNGRDIALELRESSCGSEACTDGCGEGIACRVWVHREGEYTEPPVAMIVDAILREVYGGFSVNREPEAHPYELPENLERFFAGQAALSSAERRPCCTPAERQSCCDPGDKAGCCGEDREACACR
jgi:hypothetical protein